MPPRLPASRLTHFLCIPLVTPHSRPQLQASLDRFRADVTNDRTPENPDGILDKAIRPVGTLHLTLGVMSLLSQERVDIALAKLESLDLRELLGRRKKEGKVTGLGELKKGESGGCLREDSQVDIASKDLKVTLRGLASMHTPSKTSVLYAVPVDEDGSLQSFCQKLKDAFTEAGLLAPDTKPVLLHATIVNTIYVPSLGGGRSSHGKHRARMTIDARDFLEKYEDFEWMSDVRVERVTICRMGAKKLEDGNEEYQVEGEVDMP